MERRFLALGDSYTIGEAVDDGQRWPVVLVERLRARGIAIADPLIVARTGWTVGELMDAFDAARPPGVFDLVSLLIGVNDQYRGYGVSAYGPAFDAMLWRAVACAGGDARRVIVVAIPDWGVTPFAEGRDRAAIAREVDAFNAVNAQATRDAGARYVDITDLSRRAAWDAALTASDGLHPSAAMYEQWVDVILPDALAALDAPAPPTREAASSP